MSVLDRNPNYCPIRWHLRWFPKYCEGRLTNHSSCTVPSTTSLVGRDQMNHNGNLKYHGPQPKASVVQGMSSLYCTCTSSMRNRLLLVVTHHKWRISPFSIMAMLYRVELADALGYLNLVLNAAPIVLYLTNHNGLQGRSEGSFHLYRSPPNRRGFLSRPH